MFDWFEGGGFHCSSVLCLFQLYFKLSTSKSNHLNKDSISNERTINFTMCQCLRDLRKCHSFLKKNAKVFRYMLLLNVGLPCQWWSVGVTAYARGGLDNRHVHVVDLYLYQLGVFTTILTGSSSSPN